MSTSQSIFEELKARSYPTYKELLENVGKIWQKYVGELPVEIGPKDLVELAVLRQWVQQDKDGTIRIVLPKENGKATPVATTPSNGRERVARAPAKSAMRARVTDRWRSRPLSARAARA